MGTVSTIMQTVQQTQQQTEQHNLGINLNDTHLIATEQCQQLLHNSTVVGTDSEEEPGMFNSLDITQQIIHKVSNKYRTYNHLYLHPHPLSQTQH